MKKDHIYWGIFLVIAIMTFAYLYFFANFIIDEQDAGFMEMTSVARTQKQELAALERRVEVIENINKQEIMQVTVNTNMGNFTLEFFEDKAPKTVENFIKLAEKGFYDGIKFHRVIDGFMIQSGDPFTKDDSMKDSWGKGGPGYKFDDEIHDENINAIGTISMANAGKNTNGSQFFINTYNNNFLDTGHTVFGKVVDGMSTIKKIEKVQTEGEDRPVEDVIIESMEIN